MTVQRIRWEQGKYSSYSGHVGRNRSSLFGIHWKTQRTAPNWRLTTSLPGLDRMTAEDDDRDSLETIAESWLDTFVRSLGADWRVEAENA